jgi:hypothetical protein
MVAEHKLYHPGAGLAGDRPYAHSSPSDLPAAARPSVARPNPTCLTRALTLQPSQYLGYLRGVSEFLECFRYRPLQFAQRAHSPANPQLSQLVEHVTLRQVGRQPGHMIRQGQGCHAVDDPQLGLLGK